MEGIDTAWEERPPQTRAHGRGYQGDPGLVALQRDGNGSPLGAPRTRAPRSRR